MNARDNTTHSYYDGDLCLHVYVCMHMQTHYIS
jgi:hypothetical protein